MKKILSLILIGFISLALSSCDIEIGTGSNESSQSSQQPSSQKHTPEFFGGADMEVALETNGVFNPMRGISAMANGNDVTDLIVYSIYDQNKNNQMIDEIVLSFGGTYKIIYTIPQTQTLNRVDMTRNIKVGNGYSDIDYDINSLTYELKFADEFEGDSLNLSNWTYEIGTGSWGWGNNEAQYYTDSTKNVWVKDGYLNITAIKEYKNGSQYTSGRIKTAGKVDFKYGKFEASIKLPAGRGTWPAFWMLPTNSKLGGWPNSGEIDIMESVGYNPNVIHSTVHNQLYNGGAGTQKGGSKTLNGVYEEFHKYSVEWLPDRMIFYVDDVKLFEYCPSKLSASNWPYDTEFFMLLNVAVGGNWGGVQGIDDSIFPQTMSVDYVRVYQAQELEKYL